MKNFTLGNRNLIRAINRSIILKTIKAQGTIARAEIARYTGLSPATVTGISDELIQSGLVFEKEPGDSSGGRRPIMLAINPLGGFVVGIKLMEDHALGALTDLEATQLVKISQPLNGKSPEIVAQALSELVATLFSQAAPRLAQIEGVPAVPKLMGVGIGLAGIIDAEQGIVRQSPFFGWNNIPLRKMIQETVKIPVYVDNDVNTLAFAERWFGAGEGINNFLVVTIGRGIGLGIVVNGQFYRGFRGGAGEFGHTVVKAGGQRCACGKLGCLEAYIGDAALLLQAAEAFECGKLSRAAATPDELLTLADAGESAAQIILTQAGDLLGQSIANLVNIFNPERILVNGEGVRAGHWLFDSMRLAIDEHTMPGLRGDASILIEPFGDESWARGAASLVLHKLFEAPVKHQIEYETEQV